MVMGVHLGQHIDIPGVLGIFFEKGSTGVSFFFILSGYLSYNSLEKVNNNSFRKNAVEYWIRRAIHILPLYYIVILFYFLFYTIGNAVPKDVTGLYWIRYILLLNRWVPTEIEFWSNLGAVWSISVFVLFYLIVPFYHVFVKKYYQAWIGTIVTFIIFKSMNDLYFEKAPIRYMFYFFLGILIYIAIKEKREAELAAIFAAILIFCILTGKGEILNAPLLAGMYIIATSGRKIGISEHNVIYKIISGISMISYSLYLDHALVVSLLDFFEVTNNIVFGICFVVLSFLLAVFTYCYVEKTMSKVLKDRLLG